MAATLPGSYSEMYPSRFLKADMFKGKKVTLTIKDIIGEDLIGDKDKTEAEWIVRFVEKAFEFVMNKTNAYCLYRMFGGDPHSWIGKKVTFYPTTTKFGRETVDCIRIWGSPEIAEDMPITVPAGRKKKWETVMHRTAAAKAPESVAGPNAGPVEPRILAAFEILDWTETERTAFIAKTAAMTQEQQLVLLNAAIDAGSSRDVA